MADDFPSLAAAASAPQSKKQKPKKQKITLDAFLQQEGLATGGGSWADEMDSMPTAPAPRDPNAAIDWSDKRHAKDRDYLGGPGGRDDYERPDVPIPTEPPFTAYTGNLSFETTESDIADFFASVGCSAPVSIRLVTDRDGKFKGFAYVEFASVEDLKTAIGQTGVSLGGRAIRISVAEPQRARPSDGQWRRDGPPSSFGGPGRYDDRRPNAARGYSDRYGDDTDWSLARGSKFTPSEEPSRQIRREFSSSSARSFGSDFANSRNGPRDYGAPREFGDAALDRGGFGSRFTPATSGSNSPYERASDYVPDSRRSSTGPPAALPLGEADTASTWRRAAPLPSTAPTSPGLTSPSSPSHENSPTLVRKKLALAPRTIPENTSTSPDIASPTSASSSKPNPFGAAAPVDTAAREREVEKKRQEAHAQAEKDRADRLAKEKEVPRKILSRNDGAFGKKDVEAHLSQRRPSENTAQTVSSESSRNRSGPPPNAPTGPAAQRTKADAAKALKREGFSFANAASALAAAGDNETNGMSTSSQDDTAELEEEVDEKLKVQE